MSTEAAVSSILFAGYGVYNQTGDATGPVRAAYARGQRIFLANNGWIGDPAPGKRKYLYITWASPSGEASGVTGEDDGTGIAVP